MWRRYTNRPFFLCETNHCNEFCAGDVRTSIEWLSRISSQQFVVLLTTGRQEFITSWQDKVSRQQIISRDWGILCWYKVSTSFTLFYMTVYTHMHARTHAWFLFNRPIFHDRLLLVHQKSASENICWSEIITVQMPFMMPNQQCPNTEGRYVSVINFTNKISYNLSVL